MKKRPTMKEVREQALLDAEARVLLMLDVPLPWALTIARNLARSRQFEKLRS